MRGLTGYTPSHILLGLIILMMIGTGVATAAVAGNFTSTYDGYNDDTDTEIPGHEIAVSGSVEFSGENAVNPTITVKPAQNTVLDDPSVRLQQGAGSSVEFRRINYQNGVRYSTEEIPSGSQFDLEFVVYPVSGMDQSEIKSAEVVVQYERPGGGSDEKTIEITTALSNTPPQVISSLEGSSGGTPLWMTALAVVGGLSIVIFLLLGAGSIFGNGDGPKG